MHGFKALEIWKRFRVFCTKKYYITYNFLDSEKFGLTNQYRSVSHSMPSHITEGYSKQLNKDFSRFLDIAFGSYHKIEKQ